MFFGFYKFFCACLRYNFTFILNAEGFWRKEIKMILKPNDKSGKEIVIVDDGYKALFKRAITEMRNYQ